MKKLEILLTTHHEIEKDCDFVYHLGFFNEFGNYASCEKPLNVIAITAKVFLIKSTSSTKITN